MKHTTGRIIVAESNGTYPVRYLIGPAAPPFADLPNNGPILATVHSTNPNAAGDAQLWAKAARLKELLGDLVNSIADRNKVERDNVINEAVELLKELDAE